MAEKTPPDPVADFSQIVSQWERNFDSYANQMMGTEGFSQWMNEAKKFQLGQQKAFNEFVTTQLKNVNMPTRDDVFRLAEMLQNIDRRLERIEEKLGVSDVAGREGPPRTKQPPAAYMEGADNE